MSCIVKRGDNLLAMSTLTGQETSVTELVDQSTPSRPVPLNPDAFLHMLESGVADGTIKFTNKGDVPLVASIYKRAFIDELSTAKALTYSGLGWGDEALATLLQALMFAVAQGALGNLRSLDLSWNQIGDLGITDFSRQFPIGSLRALTQLDLHHNQIGDLGMIKFSRSIAIGSKELTELDLGENNITDDGLAMLIPLFKTKLSKLTSFSIGSGITDVGMRALSDEIAIGSLRSLTQLFLNSNQIGNAGIIEFSRSIASGSMGALTLLYLYGNQIGDAGMVDFSRAIASGSLRSLEFLELGNNQIGDAGMIDFPPAKSPSGHWGGSPSSPSPAIR